MAKKLEFQCVTESEIEEVAAFLRQVFQVGPDWLPFRMDVLRWKAFPPHPFWEGNRNYVVRKEGKIVAHGCAMPSVICGPFGKLKTVCIIDWAASKAVPGAGAIVFQEIQNITESLFVVGGSTDAQKVLPRMGFAVRQEVHTFTRVLKPAQVWAAAPEKDWRSVARMGRDVWHRVKPVAANVKDWTAEPVQQFDNSIDSVLPCSESNEAAYCQRSAALLNYFLACPAVKMEGYLLRQSNALRGYCVLNRIGTSCRITDLHVQSGAEADWASAYAVAARLASADQKTIATVGGNSNPFLARPMASAGFRLTGRQPLYFKDPEHRFPEGLALAMGLMETDAFYLAG